MMLAAAWYRSAAEQGDASAQNNLGVMYANGVGVERDDVQAVDWYGARPSRTMRWRNST
jgi:TPR repeat protein